MTSIWSRMLPILFYFNHLLSYEATLSNGLNVYEIKCKDNKTCSSRNLLTDSILIFSLHSSFHKKFAASCIVSGDLI